jgi:hypothetical protein
VLCVNVVKSFIPSFQTLVFKGNQFSTKPAPKLELAISTDFVGPQAALNPAIIIDFVITA